MDSVSVPQRRAHDIQADPAMLVDEATRDARYGTPDVALNLQICDLVNQLPQDAYITVDAIKQKLRSKSHSTGLLAVILLDTLVKNVPACHDYVSTPQLMQDTLVKALPRSIRKPNEGASFNSLIHDGKDNKTPLAMARWDAILKCVKSWAIAFPADKYSTFHETLRQLERRGVQFPPMEKNEQAPIFTPKVTVPAAAGSGAAISSSAARSRASSQLAHAPTAAQAGPRASPALVAELKQCQETAKLFTDMLQNAEAGHPFAEDELLQQLFVSNRSNAGILTDRLTKAANAGDVDEGTMNALLTTHESVQQSLQLYEGLVSGTIKPGQQQPHPRAAAAANRRPSSMEERKEAKDNDDSFMPRAHAHEPPQRKESYMQDFGLAPIGAASSSFHAAPVQSSGALERPRRKSDLPDALLDFDIGITPSPEAVAHPAANHNTSFVASAPPSHNVFDAFPPAVNPAVALHVQPNASPMGANTPASRKSVTSPMIAPPPNSATRHRKRGDSHAVGANEHVGLTPPRGNSVSLPPGSGSLFDALDAQQAAAAHTPQAVHRAEGQSHHAASNIDFFAVPPATAPVQPAAVNPFDMFTNDPFAEISQRPSALSASNQQAPNANAFNF